MEMRMSKQDNSKFTMNPVKFNMWLFLGSLLMIFMSLTSAYIVRRAEGGAWDVFGLPSAFLISSALIILSSISLHWAFVSAKKNELGAVKAGLVITLMLGAGFVFSQWIAWNDLVFRDIHLSGNNVSGSFLYIISGLHAAHVVGGIGFLIATIYSAFKFRVHSKELLRIDLCTTYWHFLGGLWLYLHVFLILFR